MSTSPAPRLAAPQAHLSSARPGAAGRQFMLATLATWRMMRPPLQRNCPSDATGRAAAAPAKVTPECAPQAEFELFAGGLC